MNRDISQKRSAAKFISNLKNRCGFDRNNWIYARRDVSQSEQTKTKDFVLHIVQAFKALVVKYVIK